MVDFNNEATISTPSVDIVKVLILQARANVLEALEDYNKKLSKGLDADQSIIKSRIGTWFIEHQAYLIRNLKTAEYETLKKDFFDKIFFNPKDLTPAEIMGLIIELNIIIDKLNLTKVDYRQVYDRTRIELDNFNNELG
jgi:hypothetical protein